jgi:transposase-like protein
MDHRFDHQPKRIGENVTLAPLDLLARVIPARPSTFCGFHRLAVDHAGARTGLAPFRIACTTNAIEALNSKLRRAVRARGHFPSDEAATKLLYLILSRSEKEWKMPPRGWSMAETQFAVIFGERFIRAMAV